VICDIYPKDLAWRWVGWWIGASRRGKKATVMLERRKPKKDKEDKDEETQVSED